MPLVSLVSGGRQPDHEPRAAASAVSPVPFAASHAGRGTVLGIEASAVGDHDLARDVEPEPGVLAETLLRTVGIETLEDALDILRRNARSFVLDRDLNLGPDSARHNRDPAAGRREGDRVVEQVDDDLAQTAVMGGGAVGVGTRRIGDVEHDLTR